MYAVIEDSGTQFKISAGDVIRIERPLDQDPGKTVTFDKVLLVGGEGSPKIGAPLVAGATVSADVKGRVRGEKLDIQKYKRRKGYHKKIGHRQDYVEVKITAINA